VNLLSLNLNLTNFLGIQGNPRIFGRIVAMFATEVNRHVGLAPARPVEIIAVLTQLVVE
jgi:hypothetical protein